MKPPADVGSAGNTGGSGQVRNLGHGDHYGHLRVGGTLKSQ